MCPYLQLLVFRPRQRGKFNVKKPELFAKGSMKIGFIALFKNLAVASSWFHKPFSCARYGPKSVQLNHCEVFDS